MRQSGLTQISFCHRMTILVKSMIELTMDRLNILIKGKQKAMRKAIFKSKNNHFYCNVEDKVFMVFVPEGYKPEFKTSKNGKQYFVAEVELRCNKDGKHYFKIGE